MQGQSRERALQGLLRLVLLVSGRSSSTGRAASRRELSLVPATAAVALHARQQVPVQALLRKAESSPFQVPERRRRHGLVSFARATST